MGGRLYVALSIAALTVGGVASCSRPASTPAQEWSAPTVAPAAAPTAPAGPPNYVGIIEQVKVYPRSAPAGRPVVQVLVRYTRPDRPPDLVWAHLDDAVLEQNGAHLEAGAAVRVWASGDIAKTDPPQVWAQYIMCEQAEK